MLNLVDMPARWHEIDARRFPRLSIDVLRSMGCVPHHGLTSVFINTEALPSSVIVREWVKEHTLNGVKLFKRLHWIEQDFRIDKSFKGVCFIFNCEIDAMYFRIRWHEHNE